MLCLDRNNRDPERHCHCPGGVLWGANGLGEADSQDGEWVLGTAPQWPARCVLLTILPEDFLGRQRYHTCHSIASQIEQKRVLALCQRIHGIAY